MKIKKLISILAVAVIVILSFAGCNTSTQDDISTQQNEVTVQTAKTDVKVGILKGPTGMGSAYLWDKSKKSETLNNYSFSLETDASVMGSKVITGEYDIVAIPTNAAAALYQKSQGKIQVIALNTMGVLHILSKNGEINSVKDLEGKTIVSSGKGAVPEYALNFILSENGLNPGENVIVEYLTEHSEVVANALQGKSDIVLLPEPFVTQLMKKDSSFADSLDLTNEWSKVSEGTLTMGAFIVNTDFAKKNPKAVENFIEEYNQSQKYVNENIEKASAIIEECDILPAQVAKSAIKNSNIVCVSGKEMVDSLTSFLTVLFESNPQSIGGKMPDENFWFVK